MEIKEAAAGEGWVRGGGRERGARAVASRGSSSGSGSGEARRGAPGSSGPRRSLSLRSPRRRTGARAGRARVPASRVAAELGVPKFCPPAALAAPGCARGSAPLLRPPRPPGSGRRADPRPLRVGGSRGALPPALGGGLDRSTEFLRNFHFGLGQVLGSFLSKEAFYYPAAGQRAVGGVSFALATSLPFALLAARLPCFVGPICDSHLP